MVERTKAVCRHHWLLSEPRQDVVRGVCMRCGAQRDYPAGLEEPARYDDYEQLARPPLETRLTSLTDRGWLAE